MIDNINIQCSEPDFNPNEIDDALQHPWEKPALDTIEIATYDASIGYSVFPCLSTGTPDWKKPGKFADKAPACKNGLKDATRDPAKIELLFSQGGTLNVAIATGGVDRYFVLDEDTQKPGKPPFTAEQLAARAKFRNAIRVHIPASAKVNRVSTSNSGRHIGVKLPEGVTLRAGSGTDLLCAGSGIDWRGDGGYVLAPGSVTARHGAKVVEHDGCTGLTDAGMYESTEFYPLAELFEIPVAALDELGLLATPSATAKPGKAKASPTAKVPAHILAAQKARGGVHNTLGVTPADPDRVWGMLCAVKDRALSEGTWWPVIQILWNAAHISRELEEAVALGLADDWSKLGGAAYVSRADVEAKWNSRTEADAPLGLGTLHAWAVAAGWKDPRKAIVAPQSTDTGGSVVLQAANETINPGKIDWAFTNPDNSKPTAHPANVEVLLKALGVHVFHNTFALTYHVEIAIGTFELDDEKMRWLHQSALRLGLKMPKDGFIDTVLDLGARNKRHPVRSYLGSLVWDGVNRIDTWLHTYGGAANHPYTGAVGVLFLVSAVRRVLKPGAKCDAMPVFEGLQGGNKSTMLRVLASNDWFTDSITLGASAKEMIEQMSGKWIGENSELGGAGKSDVDMIKAQLSRVTDRARLAFGRTTSEVPRQYVMAGTMNPQAGAGYLRDPTGNRRFLPVPVKAFDLDALRRDRDQLWAEAVVREQTYGELHLPPHLWAVAAKVQEARRQTDPIEAVLADAIDGLKGFVPTEDLYSLIGLGAADGGVNKRGDRHARVIAKVMRDGGWTPARRTRPSDHQKCRGYENDPAGDWFGASGDVLVARTFKPKSTFRTATGGPGGPGGPAKTQ